MKKLIILLSLVVINITGYAQTTDGVDTKMKNIVDNVRHTASEIADSTKKSVENAVNLVDTSSNFRLMYKDMKSDLNAIADSLKVSSEYVFTILVKQQIVNSIVGLIIIIITVIYIILIVKYYKWITNSKTDIFDEHIFGIVVSAIGGIILSIIDICSLENIVMGFVNPQYGAIRDIIKIIHH